MASKFRPPVVKPPALRISNITRAFSSTLLGNWSVSQPNCGSPRLASTEPKMPSAMAVAISWWKECPARVAWLASILTLISFSSPNCFRKPYTVATS
ncbi:hypothetical protein D3C80_1413930 [compost metagenome]